MHIWKKFKKTTEISETDERCGIIDHNLLKDKKTKQNKKQKKNAQDL